MTTPLPPSYLSGLITQPLPDGGTHIITLGVFLQPLSPGTHTVSINITLSGELIGGSVSFGDSYTVTVSPSR